MEYNKNFFEGKFVNWSSSEGNMWRFWRASQINRMNIMASILADIIKDKEMVKICELGCATADFTKRYYDSKKMQVEGIDISDRAIGICKMLFEGDGNIVFYQSDIFEISKKNEFDVVICMDMLHYFNEIEVGKALEIIANMKKENGVALLSIPLDEEDEFGDSFVKIVTDRMNVVTKGYINNYFYDHTIEPKLLYLYDVLCVDCLAGRTGQMLGKLVRKLMGSISFFSLYSRFGKIFKKRMHSHIFLVAK